MLDKLYGRLHKKNTAFAYIAFIIIGIILQIVAILIEWGFGSFGDVFLAIISTNLVPLIGLALLFFAVFSNRKLLTVIVICLFGAYYLISIVLDFIEGFRFSAIVNILEIVYFLGMVALAACVVLHYKGIMTDLAQLGITLGSSVIGLIGSLIPILNIVFSGYYDFDSSLFVELIYIVGMVLIWISRPFAVASAYLCLSNNN